MITASSIEEIKAENGLAVAAGFFDGVHLGHRFLLSELQRIAKLKGLASGVITFKEHPRMVLQSDFQPKLLNSFDEKIEHLSTLGIDYCIVMDFTPEFAELGAREFIVDILADKWNVKALLTGYDHRFGHGREDGFEEYCTYGASCGMDVIRAERYNIEEKPVSSSEIRRLLAKGEVEEAARLLTYPYHLKGVVIKGRQIGRTLGFPTVNILMHEPLKMLPANGVYAANAFMDGKKYGGMLYIGDRPTFDGDRSIIPEINLFDFEGDAYGKEVTVNIIKYIREDIGFNSVSELKAKLENDRQTVLSFMNYEK